MDLSAKIDAYKSYLEQAKEAFETKDILRAKGLFLKAAEITNEMALSSTNVDIKHEYYHVTQTILRFVKENCNRVISEKPSNESTPANPGLEISSNDHVTIEIAISKLNELIGLEDVKQTIQRWIMKKNVIKKRVEQGLKSPDISYHMVFTGNPGTGKTTIARIIGTIYRAYGLLPKGHFVETDRKNLVAEYVGQTAIKTQRVIDQAIGGVLFIDEAYQLAKGGDSDFGHEAISTLLKAMEDKRDQFAVIVAGYSNNMKQFIDSNPGLKSRFQTYIHFDDYKPAELLQIFQLLCHQDDYRLSFDAARKVAQFLDEIYQNRSADFGNGREVRKLYEMILDAQSERIYGTENCTKEQLMELILEDVQTGIHFYNKFSSLLE